MDIIERELKGNSSDFLLNVYNHNYNKTKTNLRVNYFPPDNQFLAFTGPNIILMQPVEYI